MRLKFHGARGSYPTPVAPERIEEICRSVCEQSIENKVRSWAELKTLLQKKPRSLWQIYGGNTTCVELKCDESPMPIFLDAGTGLTAAAADANSGLNNADFKQKRGKAAIFMTHTHWDHIMGFPNIPQLYKNGNEITIYGVHKDLSQRLSVLFKSEYFPVPFNEVIQNIKFQQIELGSTVHLGQLKIEHFAQTHPGGSFAYKIQSATKRLVFATDTELKNIDAPHVRAGDNFYSNADVMVLDAHFSPEDAPAHQGWGHASIFSAVDFAVREKVRRLYLFHQNPVYSDAQIDQQFERALDYKNKKYSSSGLEVSMAVEGLEIEI